MGYLVPAGVEERTLHWYSWEIAGRGWNAYPYPVALEPPFRPFVWYESPRREAIDDGRRHTWLSSLVEGFAKREEPTPEPLPQVEEEVEPEPAAPPDDLAEYRVILPPEERVSVEAASRWLLTLSTCGALSFEVVGSHGEVSIQLAGERSDAQAALDSLQSFFPEAQIEEVPESLLGLWDNAPGPWYSVVEFGLARECVLPLERFSRFSPDPLTPVIGALGTLRGGELGVLQVLFEPVRAPWREHLLRSVTTPYGEPFFADAPEITKAAREKVASPLFAAVVRVAASASSRDATWEVLRRLVGALSQFGSADGNELLPVFGDAPTLRDDLLSRTTHRSGMLLSAAELVGLVHPPSENVTVPSLVRRVARTKQAPESLQGEGLRLGENVHRGESVDVRLPEDARMRHVHVIGASGTGKSTLLVQMVLDDLDAGHGVGVLDPHGDLVDAILARLPEGREDDLVLFDPSDDEHLVGWNILGARSELERELLASDLVAVFRRLSTSWGDQMTAVLSNAVLCFLDSDRGGTLLDLRRFLVDDRFRREFLETVRDEHLRSWWEYEFGLLVGRKPQAPILTRLDTFLRSKRIRELVTVRDGLDFRAVVDDGRIFLAKLAQGAIGVENAALLGSLLVSKIHQVTLTRQEQDESRRRPFYLYLDEFHEMATPSMATLFSGVRKYRLGLTVAHQDLYQLHGKVPEVERAVLANAHTRICFRVGDEDARSLERGFAYFAADDLMALRTGEAICRVGSRETDFNLLTERLDELDPDDARDRRDFLRRLSGERWGANRTEVRTEQEPARAAREAEAGKPTREEERAAPEERTTAPPRPAQEPPTQPQLDKLSLDYLTLAAREPFLSTRERNRALGLSAWKGHQVKGALIRDGLALEIAVNPGGRGERFKLLELSSAGRSLLASFGVAPETGHGRGGVAHQWWTARFATWLEAQGVSAQVEDESKGARVDLAVRITGKDIAIEIEMGDGHALENIRKDLAAGYTEVVSFLDDPDAVERLRSRALRDLGEERARSVRIEEFREHEAVLASLLDSAPPIRAPYQKREPRARGRRTPRQAPPKVALQPVSPALLESGAFTTPVAAEYLGLSPATLETMRSRGGGPPFVKLGRRVVYRQQDLDAWVAERVQE